MPCVSADGEYDYSATPEMTLELAREINATHCEIMQTWGIFRCRKIRQIPRVPVACPGAYRRLTPHGLHSRANIQPKFHPGFCNQASV